ncbi:MAG: MotA/TolQ/ExbB proton channel family protein [Sutterellaceae bacterium]|nr:MotA/TolQ/ExbB proton channel family protein [Sutterellaceae bacterium]
MEFSSSGWTQIYALIGPAGCVLIFVALFAIYVALWQLFYMAAVWRNFKRDFLDLERGKDRCLKDIDPKKANPLIRIIYEIVTTHGSHSDDIRAEVGYLFYRNFKRVSNGLCWLKLIAVISPLLGLLGTVWGMVDVFRSMSDVTQANASVLASGIWSALITTIMGLSVAIPVLMCYYYLMLKFRGFHFEAIEHSYRALEVCRKLQLGKNARRFESDNDVSPVPTNR